MVQLVLRAALQSHIPPFHTVSISCDNEGVVSHGNEPTRSLPDKQPQADVLCVLKKYLMDNATSHNVEAVFCWVAVHQDDRKRWSTLTMEERINVVAD